MRKALAAIALLLGCQTTPAAQPDYPANGYGSHGYPAATAQPVTQCPPSTHWDGYACVWRYVVTDVRCPEGSRWIDNNCVASSVVCPAGARWTLGRCIAEIETDPNAPRKHDDGEIFETRSRPSDAPDPFEYQ